MKYAVETVLSKYYKINATTFRDGESNTGGANGHRRVPPIQTGSEIKKIFGGYVEDFFDRESDFSGQRVILSGA